MKLSYISYSLILLASCHKAPSLGPAADNLSSLAPPPMGASTYNDELKKELFVLENLFNGQISTTNLAMVKASIMQGQSAHLLNSKGDDGYLAKVYLALPELMVGSSKDLGDNRKLWLLAKLYFLRRRFVEASLTMTQVLKIEPDFHQARNWRARAIFFLGNPDLAVAELNKIVAQSPKKSADSLDALYLIGAIVHEANDTEPARIAKGMTAWTAYLAEASPDKELQDEITNGIKELERRKAGQDAEPTLLALDPFAPQDGYSAEKNAILTAFAKEELLLALQLAENLLKNQDDKDIALIKARIFIKTGRNDEASDLFKNITTKHKTYAPAFHYQGMAHMLKGEVREALESWQKTFELDEAYAKSHRLDQRIAVAEKMVVP